jgi:hypothetical protein
VSRISLLLIGVLAGGCATAPRPDRTATVAEPRYEDATCAALAFDPPLTANSVHPEFARGPRQAAAVMGYDEATVESYTTVTDNLESSPFGDAYGKESVSVKSSTRTR